MERAMAALEVCADRVKRRNVLKVRAVATQACRMAENGPEFIEKVRAGDRPGAGDHHAQAGGPALGRRLPRACSTAGAEAALVVDVGGGSTELSWVDLTRRQLDQHVRRFAPQRLPIRAWLSIPIGVVTLAERFPEGETGGTAWFRAMVEHVKARDRRLPSTPTPCAPIFDAGRGAPGRHLRRHHQPGRAAPGPDALRAGRVDGLWMTRADCEAAADRLMTLTPQGAGRRALHRTRPRRPGPGRRRDPAGGAGAVALRARAGRRPRPARGPAAVADGRAGARRRRAAASAATGRDSRRGGRDGRRAAAQTDGAPADAAARTGAGDAGAAEDRLQAHALVAGLAGAPDQRPLRRRGRGPRATARRAAFKLTEIDDRLHLIKRGRPGDRPGLRARRLDPGGAGARRGRRGGRRPAAGRPAGPAAHHPDGLHRSRLRDPADRR